MANGDDQSGSGYSFFGPGAGTVAGKAAKKTFNWFRGPFAPQEPLDTSEDERKAAWPDPRVGLHGRSQMGYHDDTEYTPYVSDDALPSPYHSPSQRHGQGYAPLGDPQSHEENTLPTGYVWWKDPIALHAHEDKAAAQEQIRANMRARAVGQPGFGAVGANAAQDFEGPWGPQQTWENYYNMPGPNPAVTNPRMIGNDWYTQSRRDLSRATGIDPAFASRFAAAEAMSGLNMTKQYWQEEMRNRLQEQHLRNVGLSQQTGAQERALRILRELPSSYTMDPANKAHVEELIRQAGANFAPTAPTAGPAAAPAAKPGDTSWIPGGVGGAIEGAVGMLPWLVGATPQGRLAQVGALGLRAAASYFGPKLAHSMEPESMQQAEQDNPNAYGVGAVLGGLGTYGMRGRIRSALGSIGLGGGGTAGPGTGGPAPGPGPGMGPTGAPQGGPMPGASPTPGTAGFYGPQQPIGPQAPPPPGPGQPGFVGPTQPPPGSPPPRPSGPGPIPAPPFFRPPPVGPSPGGPATPGGGGLTPGGGGGVTPGGGGAFPGTGMGMGQGGGGAAGFGGTAGRMTAGSGGIPRPSQARTAIGSASEPGAATPQVQSITPPVLNVTPTGAPMSTPDVGAVPMTATLPSETMPLGDIGSRIQAGGQASSRTERPIPAAPVEALAGERTTETGPSRGGVVGFNKLGLVPERTHMRDPALGPNYGPNVRDELPAVQRQLPTGHEAGRWRLQYEDERNPRMAEYMNRFRDSIPQEQQQQLMPDEDPAQRRERIEGLRARIRWLMYGPQPFQGPSPHGEPVDPMTGAPTVAPAERFAGRGVSLIDTPPHQAVTESRANEMGRIADRIYSTRDEPRPSYDEWLPAEAAIERRLPYGPLSRTGHLTDVEMLPEPIQRDIPYSSPARFNELGTIIERDRGRFPPPNAEQFQQGVWPARRPRSQGGEPVMAAADVPMPHGPPGRLGIPESVEDPAARLARWERMHPGSIAQEQQQQMMPGPEEGDPASVPPLTPAILARLNRAREAAFLRLGEGRGSIYPSNPRFIGPRSPEAQRQYDRLEDLTMRPGDPGFIGPVMPVEEAARHLAALPFGRVSRGGNFNYNPSGWIGSRSHMREPYSEVVPPYGSSFIGPLQPYGSTFIGPIQPAAQRELPTGPLDWRGRLTHVERRR